jgi:hypothetical protein
MLREWWKRQRAAREAAELTAEQTDQLLGAYETRLAELAAA